VGGEIRVKITLEESCDWLRDALVQHKGDVGAVMAEFKQVLERLRMLAT
jgi:hypothetical protein